MFNLWLTNCWRLSMCLTVYKKIIRKGKSNVLISLNNSCLPRADSIIGWFRIRVSIIIQAGSEGRIKSYRMSKKARPNLYSNLLYKIGQDFLGKQYLQNRLFIRLMDLMMWREKSSLFVGLVFAYAANYFVAKCKCNPHYFWTKKILFRVILRFFGFWIKIFMSSVRKTELNFITKHANSIFNFIIIYLSFFLLFFPYSIVGGESFPRNLNLHQKLIKRKFSKKEKKQKKKKNFFNWILFIIFNISIKGI